MRRDAVITGRLRAGDDARRRSSGSRRCWETTRGGSTRPAASRSHPIHFARSKDSAHRLASRTASLQPRRLNRRRSPWPTFQWGLRHRSSRALHRSMDPATTRPLPLRPAPSYLALPLRHSTPLQRWRRFRRCRRRPHRCRHCRRWRPHCLRLRFLRRCCLRQRFRRLRCHLYWRHPVRPLRRLRHLVRQPLRRCHQTHLPRHSSRRHWLHLHHRRSHLRRLRHRLHRHLHWRHRRSHLHRLRHRRLQRLHRHPHWRHLHLHLLRHRHRHRHRHRGIAGGCRQRAVRRAGKG